MRTLLALASLAVLVGAGSGCGDDTTSGAVDMTMSADLHMAGGGDMAKMNCGQLLMCVSACTSQTCVGTCAAGASTTAVTKAGQLAACIAGQCGMVDGGSGACTSTGDMTPACTQCEMTAVLGPCGTAYSTCQADM